MQDVSGAPICAIATAPGQAGIAIVRISGEGALSLARRVFKKKARGPYESHRMYYGLAVENDAPIDECMGVYFAAPRSYTGEEAFEIQCHGGDVAANAVLSALLSAGGRLAEPGEFTKRAFLNGRLSLDEAEAVMDFIGARTRAAARGALSRLQGALAHNLRPVADTLLDMAASLEALLEYPDEDIEEEQIALALSRLAPCRAALARAIQNAPAAELLRRGVRVVLFGAPNAGKSSLLNALLLKQRAIVTDQPGTTRDVLREELSLNGLPVRLSDTAGLRAAAGEAEEIGVRLAREEVAQADLALLVLDRAEQALPELPALSCPLVAVLNKSDLPPRLTAEEVQSAYRPAAVAQTCALTGEGVDELRQTLYRLCLQEMDVEDASLAGERQLALAKEGLSALNEAQDALEQGLIDLAAISLRAAYLAICQIFGENADENVIDRIFEKFCLGK